MKVLWVCNIMLPAVAKHLNREVSNREGWLTGLADTLLRKGAGVELALAFPVDGELDGGKWMVPFDLGTGGQKEVLCYGFYENTMDIEQHDEEVGGRLLKILEDYKPDVVHCFGTEYDHSFVLVQVWNPEKILIGMQGVCGAIADAYFADLPEKVINGVTFRDFLKKDNIRQQKEKFEKRSLREKRTLQAAKHVTGRTDLDKSYCEEINPQITYHRMNETLRSEFYEGKWEAAKCEKYSIFVSQGDYPIKGLHYMLGAMPEILKVYPGAKLYVAGNSIVNWSTWKDKIKISSYGKYLRELMKRYGLQDKVFFTGKLDAKGMKERMLKSHLFVCCSAMENSPNSLGEAMLLGVPCVTADVGGVPTLFRDREDGIVYAGHKSKSGQEAKAVQTFGLSQAVLSMWGDEAQMLEYCENARKHGRETHDGNKNFERLMEIYCQLSGE
ncbi:MAG: glycosyltransferase family 4 protein [Lachnospiraceae bacterium]|nr:glycosyltransferase family 4 protein [Lachnospiraceae bacterium]